MPDAVRAARAALTALILASPAPAWAGEQIARCLALDPNTDPDATTSACEQALTQDPVGATLAEVLVNLGVARRELDDLEGSRRRLEQALTHAPDNPRIWRMLAWTERELGDLAAAEKSLTHAITLAPHWQGWLSRCVVRTGLGAFRGAIDDCTRALDLDPDNLDALFFKALALNEAGEPEGVPAIVRHAQTLWNCPARLYREGVRAMIALDDRPGAGDLLKEGLRLFPDDPKLNELRVSAGF